MSRGMSVVLAVAVTGSLAAAPAGVTYYLKIDGVAGNRIDSVSRARADLLQTATEQKKQLQKSVEEKQKELEKLKKEAEERAGRESFFNQIGSFFGSDPGAGTVTPVAGRAVTIHVSAGALLSRLQSAAASGERFPQALVDACPSNGPCQRYVLRNVTVAKSSPGNREQVTLRCSSMDGPSPAGSASGINALIGVTQLKAGDANKEAMDAAEAQRKLLAKEKELRAREEALERIKSPTPTPNPARKLGVATAH